MCGKLEFLLLFLQLWHFAMPNKTLDTQLDSNKTVRAKTLIPAGSNFPIQIGNKVYHIETKLEVNWYQAGENCRKLGGHLWNIESKKEMNAVLAKAPVFRYWVSANCLGRFNSWISATTGYPMPYMRWLSGQPDNAKRDEFCVEVLRTGLNDLGCKTSYTSYICEAKSYII